MKIGLFGGTFNPIHSGHMILARLVLLEFNLDCIHFIPTFKTNYKQTTGNTTHRKKMLNLAIKNNKKFKLNDIELKNKRISYTCDTVKCLSNKKDRFYLILGDEWLMKFLTWNNYRDIFKYAELIVVKRSKEKRGIPRSLSEFKNRILFSKNPVIDISSSLIRGLIKRGRDAEDLVPDKVYEYIIKHGLYSPE